MIFKQLQANIKNQRVELNFKDSPCNILKSSYALDIMHVLETLLIGDTVGYLADYDHSKYGYNYDKNEESRLLFNNGSDIRIANRSAYHTGSKHNIHCIRYIGGDEIRSTLINDNVAESPNTKGMTTYSDILSDVQWIKLTEYVNNFIGSEVVSITADKKLQFTFTQNDKFSVDAQQLIYILIAECFLTPEGYKRIVLLPKTNILTDRQVLDLINVLRKIPRHEVVLTNIEASPTDLRDDDDAVVVNL